jgi:hypothetical protein
VTELLEVDVAAAGSGEEEARVDPRRDRIERCEHSLTERDGADAAGGLAALFQLTPGEPPSYVHDTLLAVQVAALY